MLRVFRLRPHGEFDRIHRAGRRWSHPLLIIVTQVRSDNSIDRARVSVAAGKKLGGAVIRNRVKRKLRAAVRQVYPYLPASTDLIIIARQPSLVATTAEIASALTAMLRRAQLWQDRSQAEN